MTKSYSETLEAVMDFFDWHGISLTSRFPKQINDDGEKTRKRINALIAIVKDIEKTQTIPTNEMLLALFGQHEIVKKRRRPKFEEKQPEKLTREQWNRLEGMVPRERLEEMKEKHKREKKEVLAFLLKIRLAKPRFGKRYWTLETNANELSQLKRKMGTDY